MKDLYRQKRRLKALVIILELLAVGLIIYIVTLPFYPEIEYGIKYASEEKKQEAKQIEKVIEKTKVVIEKNKEEVNHLPTNDYDISPNRLVITKIGVNAPIVESKSAEYGLALGVWHVPESSTPDKGGNTVLTGHRFKYLPPSNLTFYLFHKLETEDIISVIYKEKEYYYRIKEVKIVDKTETSILDKSENQILTLFTCHPIYSTDKRLVVIAELIKGN